MDVITILNTIKANSSALYQDRVPSATRSNIAEIGTSVLAYESLTNEFVTALVQRICYTEVSNRRYRNPLAVLKSGSIPFGNTIEEVYTNPAKATEFDGNNTSDLLTLAKPDTATIYHERNRKDKYKVSISYEQLQTAFLGINEMGSFIQSVIDSMYSGDEIDEFLLMKQAVATAISGNKMKSYSVTYDGGEASCKDLVKLIKTLSSNMTFASKEFNGFNLAHATEISSGSITGRVTWCPKENQVILIRSDVDAATDVEVLAKAFNMDKVEFAKRKFVVDSFGDTDTLVVIADEKYFKFKDNVYTTKRFENGSNLTINYWLHHWQTISLSLFANAVALKQASV